MKLTALLLLISSLQVNAFTLAQLSISVKEAPLEKVFDIIRKEAGMHVFYQQKDLSGARKVTLQLQNVSVETVLKKALEGQQLTYAIDGKNIFIRKPPPPVNLIALNDLPDSLINVQGKIVNDKQEVVQGATIRVKNNEKATLSNERGEFQLQNIPGSSTLIITSVNYSPQEIRVNGRAFLDLTLSINVSSLKEVVIMNTGYQQLNKERFVGAVAVLDSTDYARRPAADIISRLDGMIPGILFDKKSPNVSQLKNVQIRGLSTLSLLQESASTEPLIIVDNFPFRQDLLSLNPNDIESITVLKDAAAASIWGAQAGNGVIVITTKKAKYNQPFNVSVTANLTLQSKPDAYFLPGMQVADFIDMETMLFQQGKYNQELEDVFSWPVISPVVEMLAKRRDGLISAKDSADLIAAYKRMDTRGDINKYINRAGFQQQYHLQLTGGNNLFNYGMSGGYNRSLSSIQNSQPSDMYTLNLNSGIKLIDDLEIRTSINLSQANTRNAAFSFPNKLYPYAQLADENGTALAIPNQYRMAWIDTAGGGQLLDWKYRPLDEIRNANSKTTTRFVQLSTAITYKIKPWLTGTLYYQYSNQVEDTRTLNSLRMYSTRNSINQFTNLSETNPYLRNPLPVGGILDLAHSERKSHNLRGQLDFSHTFNSLHAVSAFIAGDISETKGTGNGSRAYGYDDVTGKQVTAVDYVNRYPLYGGFGKTNIQNGERVDAETNRRMVSLSGNLSYNYDGRYTIYVSGRKDGSNVFGVKTNNKWKPLWSTGVSWELTKEKFVDIDWLNLFRMRASYGYAGNPGNATGFPILFYSPTRVPLTGLPRADIATTPNPYLKWEKVKTINWGADFSILKNRLSGSIDLFRKRSTDVLWVNPPAPSTGTSSYISNAAELKGKGFELTLRSVNIDRQVKWQTVFNLSHAKTTVVKVHQTQFSAMFFSSYAANPSPGMMLYGISGFRWAGLDPDNGDPMGYWDNKPSKDYGNIIRDSLHKQVFKGSSIPLYFGNLSNTVSWKNFTLFVNLVYRLDFYYRKPSIDYGQLIDNWVGNADYTLRWKQRGDEKTTTVPSFVYPSNTDRDLFYTLSEVNLLRGDNIRLEDIRLQYTANFKRKKLPFKNMNLSLSANRLNIMIWKKAPSGYDPDITGGDGLVSQPLKNWTLGLNMNF